MSRNSVNILFWCFLGGILISPTLAPGQVIVVPWDSDVRVIPPANNVYQNNRAVNVGHSYYWGDPKLGRGLPGWPADSRPGFQQGGRSTYGGIGMSGTVQNGYSLMLNGMTQTPFVTSSVPVVGDYGTVTSTSYNSGYRKQNSNNFRQQDDRSRSSSRRQNQRSFKMLDE